MVRVVRRLLTRSEFSTSQENLDELLEESASAVTSDGRQSHLAPSVNQQLSFAKMEELSEETNAPTAVTAAPRLKVLQ